jgi:two-component system, sensor histidine kinase PdtaS
MATGPARRVSGRWIARLPTTAKVILVFTFALFPLGLIALLAALETTRTSDAQHVAELRIAATEVSRKLETELASDIFVMRQAVAQLDLDPGNLDTCTRLSAVMASRGKAAGRWALFGPGNLALCGAGPAGIVRPPIALDGRIIAAKAVGRILQVSAYSAAGSAVAVTQYDAARLAAFSRPVGNAAKYRLALDVDGTELVLGGEEVGLLQRTESETLPLGVAGMNLTMTVDSMPFGAAEALVAFLPLVMWIAAVVIGYVVVDLFLVRPLGALRKAVGTYVPGSGKLVLGSTAAVEIRELEQSFSDYADRLAQREGEVERALQNQMTLTREVHHRVKNNLQVIASLISLHARGATTDDAVQAYASIQRRVDALAIVHRNHFAELEASTGIDARAMLGELVSNFRGTARFSDRTSAPGLSLTAAPVQLSQDVAMPLAFLVTELIELAAGNGDGPIAVTLNDPEAGTSLLSISSPAFRADPAENQGPSARIMNGLARQLRAPLTRDADSGCYSIAIPVLTRA